MKNYSNLIFFLAVVFLSACKKENTGSIQLAQHCPPGFELTSDNKCLCRSLYHQYNSLNNAGVGGLQTGLPAVRDGFTPQQIDLGRYLFFDPILSGNKKLSCASCHNPGKGFSDGQARSIGFNGQLLNRAAPTLWNVAFLNSFFWDARATTLEEQMKGPLYAENEMNNTEEKLLASLNAIPDYRELFMQAFPAKQKNEIQLNEIYTALAAFESSLISLNSRYDLYAHGYHEALKPNEIEGMNVFRSFVARCAECHTPPLFTNQQIAVLGTPEQDDLPFDAGAEKTFNDPSMRGGFKVPTLRNIAQTAPYMHSGKFASLQDVVTFYNSGRGHAVPENEKLSLHWHIWEPNLTLHEIERVVDFLKTLTDESFLPLTPESLPSGLSNVHKNKTTTNTLIN